MATFSNGFRVIAATVLLGVALIYSADRAGAIQDSEDKVWFGPVGITPGERALINIYTIGDPDIAGTPTHLPWDFIVRVFDRRGTLIQERTLRVAVGAIATVEVAVQDEENSLVAVGRRTFRAEIVGFNPQPDPPGHYGATLEVVNRLTGRTSLLLGNPDTLPPVGIGDSR
jgi:hypothetical protein